MDFDNGILNGMDLAMDLAMDLVMDLAMDLAMDLDAFANPSMLLQIHQWILLFQCFLNAF